MFAVDSSAVRRTKASLLAWARAEQSGAILAGSQERICLWNDVVEKLAVSMDELLLGEKEIVEKR